MNPFETIAKAQARLLRSSAWQVLLIGLLVVGTAPFHDGPLPWFAFGAALGLIALPHLLGEPGSGRASWIFVHPLSLLALAAPWWLGGARHPLVLLPIVGLHVAAFLLGVRQALWLAGAAIANLAALAVCETRGLVHGAPPDPATVLLFVAAMALHGMFFVSTPLDVVRQLLTTAGRDLAERQANEGALLALTDSLESNVARRADELLDKRRRLQRSVDELAANMEAGIDELRAAARELAGSFPADDESGWMALRISAGCERMETRHRALHRFCLLGEASLNPRILSSRDHTAMVHRLWNEARSLCPERTVSFFLDAIPECVGDPELLSQVWQHLLSNALRSTACASNAAVHVHFAEGEYHVEDNGPGSPPSDRPSGELPCQPEGDDPALEGIGLAISRRIVEMHGGSLRVESLPNKGAVVRFGLRTDPPSSTSD